MKITTTNQIIKKLSLIMVEISSILPCFSVFYEDLLINYILIGAPDDTDGNIIKNGQLLC